MYNLRLQSKDQPEKEQPLSLTLQIAQRECKSGTNVTGMPGHLQYSHIHHM